MSESKPQEKGPSYVINNPEGMQTVEFKKLQTIQMVMDTLQRAWPTETWDTNDFSKAVKEAIGRTKPGDISKLEALAARLKPVVEAVVVPEEQRTPEQAQIVAAEVQTADADGDGKVSKLEAMQRTYDIMMEVGLESAAAIFKQNRMDPLANA